MAFAGFADLVFRESLGRSLNVSLDLYLLDAVYRLAVGNSGSLRTLVAMAGVALLLGLAVLATARLLEPAARGLAGPDDERLGAGEPGAGGTAGPRAGLARGLVVGALALALGGTVIGAIGRRVVTPAASLLMDQASLARETRRERIAFAADLARPDRLADVAQPFVGLAGRDVVLAYIESYGMAALEDPELAAVVAPRLEAMAERLEAAGVHVVSGTLASPTLGGQSWYAHGTMLSGLPLENQLRYELLLASERETLVDDFRRGGYRTATVMPAITTAWPEAVRIGYDDIYTRQNIPYAGPPFYWVTMPDQFTWSFLGSLLDDATTPLFVEAGMLSSHAPWTPVLPLVAWDAIGDGAVFEPYRLDGYPPEEIWWDVDTLREGYAQSLAYALDAAAGFAARLLDERTLLIVAGDHQAAPWVTGASGPDVPVHVISRDRAVLEPFVAWGFQPGAFPDATRSAPRMDRFREWFVRAFGGVAPLPG
jgi:hypothetical protein